MKSSAQVVVIGGGVVGASVLYHLTKAGWTDVVLVEKATLTSGSTWHAAGGMHTLNGDPNVARLQQYTVNLYKEIEKESGQNCGIHLPGGIQLADTPERLDWLRMAQARGRYLGMHMEIISVKEAKELNPLLEEKYFVGALFDEDEGSVDPYGVTHAYVICAKNRGAEVYQNTWVKGLEQRVVLLRLGDGDDVHVHAEVPASCLGHAQPVEPLRCVGELEAAGQVDRAVLPRLRLDLLVQVDRVLLEAGHVGVAIQRVHATRRVPRRARRQLLALEQHDVGPTGLGEVEQHARADDATSDDHHLC